MTHRRITPKGAFEAAFWLLLLGFVGYRMWPQVAAAFGVADRGTRAPEFQVATLGGDTVSTASLRGKVVLVNVWATWCPPCRVEMPGFQRVYDGRKDRGFTILGVSTDAAGSGKVTEFLMERGITYPVAMATSPLLRGFGDPRTLPTSYLIDREGRIRHEVQGIFTSVALEQAVDRLLDEPATADLQSGGR